MDKSKYSFGQCKHCRKLTALKDGVCSDCTVKVSGKGFMGMFNDIVNKIGDK